MNCGKRVGGFAALEDYDGYEFVFENGYCARLGVMSQPILNRSILSI
jgi:hypothetical protein